MNPRRSEPGLAGKLLAVVVGSVLLVLGFIFSVFLIAAIAVVGLGGGAYFYWKTRKLRKILREQAMHGEMGGMGEMGEGEASEGEIIEGEAVVVTDGDESAERKRIIGQ